MIPKYCPTYSLRDLWRAAVPRQTDGWRLQELLATLYGVRHVLLLRSARSGLRAVLEALGTRGAAVVPAYNCMAVPDAVVAAGWRPQWADVGPDDVNITAATLDAAADGGTRVAILTHQFGVPPEIDAILDVCRRRRLYVLEDAAPAIGARYRGRLAGQFGDASVISFHLAKVVGAGHGGALLTNDDDLARRITAVETLRTGRRTSFSDGCRAALWWTGTRRPLYAILRRMRACLRKDLLYEVVPPGRSPRTSPLQPCSEFVARLMQGQLGAVETNVSVRRSLARIYTTKLAGVREIATCPVPDGAEPSWSQFPVFVADKVACYRHLLRHGVDLNWTFRYACGAGYGVCDTPEAERAARRVLGLPTYPGLAADEARRICDLLRAFVGRCETSTRGRST